MTAYILRRTGYAFLLVWGIASVTFCMIHLAPGDPSSLYLRPDIDPQTVAHIRKLLGLDLPLWQQYLNWLYAACSGFFGISFAHHRPVADILGEAIPNTLRLTVVVFFLQLFAGMAFGILLTVTRRRIIRAMASFFLTLLYSLPGFAIALLLIYLFSYRLGWFPSSQMAGLSASGSGPAAELADAVRHLVLPAVAFALPLAAYTARLTWSSLSEVMDKPYIQAATVLGISPIRILFSDALRNALLPLITLSGLLFPLLLSGSVIIESIFAWPGMGTIAIQAIYSYDYPVIIALSICAAISVIMGNLLADLLYICVDPRINLYRGGN